MSGTLELGLAAGGVSALGELFSGEQTAQLEEDKARRDFSSALVNHVLLDQAKQDARVRAAREAWASEMRTTQEVSDTRASMLQSGFDVGGSGLAVLNQIRDFGRLDSLVALYNGDVEAREIENRQAVGLAGALAGQETSRRSARGARTAGLIRGVSSVLAGGLGAYARGSSVRDYARGGYL